MQTELEAVSAAGPSTAPAALALMITLGLGFPFTGLADPAHRAAGPPAVCAGCRGAPVHGYFSASEVESEIRRIIAASGLQQNFTIRQQSYPGVAAALIENRQRVIIYDPQRFTEMMEAAESRWAPISVLAHEIGHHLNGHTLDTAGSTPPKEREADYFSGFILQKLGATLWQAQIAMNLYGSPQGSSTHPPKDVRLAEIARGWQAACARDVTCGGPPPQRPTNRPSTDLKARPLHLVTDECRLWGQTLEINALNQIVDPRRNTRILGTRQPPRSSRCVFDLFDASNGQRYCVASPSGLILGPGAQIIGECWPVR